VLWQQKKDALVYQENLLAQKHQLELLRQELIINKEEVARGNQEFHFNNITHIVYKQIERFENALNQFEYDNMKGFDAFKYLFVKIELKETEVFNKTKHESIKAFNSFNGYELKELVALETMSYFAFEGAKTIITLKQTLLKSDCTEEQVNQLKALFVNNINARYFIFIDKYLHVIKKKITTISEEHKSSLFQKEMFLKDNEVAKNLKEIIDFKKRKIVKAQKLN
jgi:hypothetical protein